MKTQSYFYCLFILTCSFLGCKKIETDITKIAGELNISLNRYHNEIQLAFIKEINNGKITYLDVNDIPFFEITLFEIGKQNNCLTNIIGTKEYKLIDAGNGTAVLSFGIHEDFCPKQGPDHKYKIGVKIEDIRASKQFLTAYKYILLAGETDIYEMQLEPANSTGVSKLEEQGIVQQTGGQSNNTYSFFSNEVTLQLSSAYLLSTEGKKITGDQLFNATVTYIKDSPTDFIQNNTAFPVPALAQQFLDSIGEPTPPIAEFIKTDYVGLEITQKNTNLRGVQLDNGGQVRITVNTNNGNLDTFQIWRFYEEDNAFKWQQIAGTLISTAGTIQFDSPLALGWAICSSPPLPSCTDPTAPYAVLDLTLNANLNGLSINDLFVAKLFDAATNIEMTNITPQINGNNITIYDVAEKETILRLYRKKIGGNTSTIPSGEFNIPGCGYVGAESLNLPPTTKLHIDIHQAFCDEASVVNIEIKPSIYVIAATNLSQPSLSSPSWYRLGTMQGGQLTTTLLEHNESYWFKVAEPQYNRAKVFHRPIKIINNNIKPIPATNSGRLICTQAGNNYNCQFVINNDYSVEELYETGASYCELLNF